jgi:Rad3-related DNA helicase
LILKNKEFLSLFLTKNNNIDDMQYITLDNIKKHILLLINVEKLINIFFSKNTKIIILASILEKIYNFYIKQGENLIDSYTFFLFLEKKEKNEQIIKLNMYCFDPSIAFKEFILDLKPYSVFLISNYFGPYDLLENEFKIRFDIKLQNNCIYQKDFFQFNIIESTLFKEEKIDFILDEINSNNIKMKLALGYTLLSLCYSNPKGNILVFFPSMTYLYQCNLIWKENNIIDDISKIKKVKFFQEEEEISNKEIKNKNYIYFTEFDTSNSYNKLKEAKNKKINMVIILGIPQEKQYNFNDKIQLKKNYRIERILAPSIISKKRGRAPNLVIKIFKKII